MVDWNAALIITGSVSFSPYFMNGRIAAREENIPALSEKHHP